MEKVNHLFLFKGKLQTKRLPPPQMCLPQQSRRQCHGCTFPNPASLLSYAAETSCSQRACLALRGSRDTA